MSQPQGSTQPVRPKPRRQRLPPLLMLRSYAHSCRILRPRFLLSFSPLCNLSLNPLLFGRIRYSALFMIFWRRTSAGRLAFAWRLVRILDLLMITPESHTDVFYRLTVEICSAGEIAREGVQQIISGVAFSQGARLLICPFVRGDSHGVATMRRWGLPSTPFMIYIRVRSRQQCTVMACIHYML
ncbi:putative protein [Ferret hepatitis E virus]|uniref:Uncharacterized protein n=1 Tax=Ferret hepatitis E virus TaxID=1213422 RepID=I7AHE4_9VIRU|nr:putative protein [Ferret hepatitis E virus]